MSHALAVQAGTAINPDVCHTCESLSLILISGSVCVSTYQSPFFLISNIFQATRNKLRDKKKPERQSQREALNASVKHCKIMYCVKEGKVSNHGNISPPALTSAKRNTDQKLPTLTYRHLTACLLQSFDSSVCHLNVLFWLHVCCLSW